MGNKAAKLHPEDIKDLRQSLDEEFTDDEIKDWYFEYSKALRKGEKCLSKAAFISVYNQLFYGDASHFAERVFKVFDANANGVVDFQEFMTGLYMSGTSNKDVKLEWAFKMYDENNDGFISKEEMNNMLNAVCKMTLTSIPENFKSTEELTDWIFEKMDKDGNNILSWDEFVEGVQKVELVLDVLECDPHPHEEGDDQQSEDNK